MSAGQEVGPLDREGRSLIQPPLPPDEATRALAAAAGVSTVGLRPSFVTPAAAHSHPDCRAILILIVAPHIAEYEAKPISERVKAAIVASKARGVVWGGNRNAPTAHLGKLGALAMRDESDAPRLAR